MIPLLYDKPFYNIQDISAFIEIRNIIETVFKERGMHSTKKGLLSSKEKEVWNCECGEKNNELYQKCSSCKRDIYGFKEGEVSKDVAIKSIDTQVQLIKEILEVE